jgi:HlyD family secretion protein
MRKTSLITIAAIAVLTLIGILVRQVAFAKEPVQYRLAKVTRGDMKATVSATGTLNAVTTISVGTQVSGQISDLYVDFNDHVKKGQLLARIDPTLAQQAVTDAQANLEKAQAQAVQASRDFSRNRELMNSGLVARSEYEQTQSGSEVAQAGVKSARIALDRARQNLAYTNIYAPIDGVVVDRDVQKGQTVAASLSAPQLFVIANDLSQMQILAQVGESDIAQIKQGQTAEFTVQALQGRTFQGTVQQVRLQSTTQDNVVNYTVVVGVNNPKGQLLPGMTARVNFLTKSAENVLKVPNAALRFKPTTQSTQSTQQPQQPRSSRRQGTLYVLDANGNPQAIKVQTGITDGTTTEVRGDGIKDGMQVITGTLGAAQQQTASSGSASPFQGGQQSGGRGARGGF